MPNESYHHGNLREALLQRAVEVLNAAGPEALSLRALARDLGVSHSAPLRHFATKADLLQGVAEAGAARLIETTEAAVTATDPRARLMQMATAYVTWAQQNPAYHHVLRNPLVLRHASERLTDRLVAFAARQRAEITAAQAAGWRAEADPDVVLIHLMSLTAGTAMIATDPSYRGPMGGALSADQAEASLALFLG